MKIFLAVSALALVASALPTDIYKEGDIGYVSQIRRDAANFTNGRAPAGQIGFATLNGGTTGGNGGAEWTVWDAWALKDAVATNNRRIVYVRGRIDLTVLFTGSPGVRIDVGRQKTIIGGDSAAMIFGGGIRIKEQRQVIVQNIKFHNALSYASGEKPNGAGGITSFNGAAFSEIDAIDILKSTNIWIDHCEFADDPWIWSNQVAARRRHDGLIDVKRASNWITISNSIFRNHNHVMLIGHSDRNAAEDRGKLKVTLYRNWFQGTHQRNPRVRYGEVHVLNNFYSDLTGYGVGIGAGASVYSERNAFLNCRRAWGWASGVPNPLGHYLNFNNQLVNSGHDSGLTGGAVTWKPEQRYKYDAMAASRVESHVRQHAGTW